MAKQNFLGMVISQGKMAKTVKVRVQAPKYDGKVDKMVLRRKDYLVHDEGNLCKEGDIVRIESIPKISSRKYFAIAEIKLNQGQQFALYETVAKEKVAQEETAKINDFLANREKLQSTISQIEDLKLLDKLTAAYQTHPEEERQLLLAEINRVKEKYGIKSWPSSEPVLELEVEKKTQEISEEERKIESIKSKIQMLMTAEYADQRSAILKLMTKSDITNLPAYTQRNLLRKYMTSGNEVEVASL